MAQTKTQRILRYTLYGLLAFGVMALLLYFFVIRTIQINHQKQNFTKAEASLDNLEKQIEAKIGKPDQIKKEKSCDRANLKSEKGPLGCDITINLLYENKDADNSSLLVKSASQLVGLSSLESLSKTTSVFTNKNLRGGDQNIDQHGNNIGPLSCGVRYTYPVVARLGQPFILHYDSNLRLELSCGGPAMQEYFPLKN